MKREKEEKELTSTDLRLDLIAHRNPPEPVSPKSGRSRLFHCPLLSFFMMNFVSVVIGMGDSPMSVKLLVPGHRGISRTNAHVGDRHAHWSRSVCGTQPAPSPIPDPASTRLFLSFQRCTNSSTPMVSPVDVPVDPVEFSDSPVLRWSGSPSTVPSPHRPVGLSPDPGWKKQVRKIERRERGRKIK